MAREGQLGETTVSHFRAPVSGAVTHGTWERLFDQAAVGVMHVDRHLQFIRVNQRVADMLGYTREELAGQHACNFTHPDDVSLSLDTVNGLTAEHPTRQFEKRYLRKDGTPVWVSMAVSAFHDFAGEVHSYVAVMEDITERKAQAEMLETEKRVLERIATGAELGEVLEEIARLWERHSHSYPWCAITLSSSDGKRSWVAAAPGLPAAFKGMMWSPSGGMPLFTGAEESMVQDLQTGPSDLPERGILLSLDIRAYWRCPVIGSQGQTLGGLLVCAPQAASPHGDDRGLMERLIHLTRIAIEKSQVEHEVTQLSNFDHLTGLPNRGVALDHLDKALARGARQRRRTALFLLNLDGMSRINDSLGYAFGDEFIKAVARRLREHLKSDQTLARFGGDEFALVLENAPDDAAVGRIAQGLLDCITRPLKVSDQEIFVTASLGAGLAAGGEMDGEALFRRADAALHRAKSRGGNSFRSYTPDMDSSAGRLELLSELRHALERGEFRVHYQPQQDLKDGSVVGAEALLRWQHPRRGLMQPDRFIPLLEETGLILPVGEWLVRQVCRDIARLRVEGLEPPRVAVNLSARQFHQPDLAERFAAILAETGVDGAQLGVEITESLMMHEPDLTARTLHRLKGLKLSVSVDDFGIAYSSFSYLKRFPIDVLKVDKSFVDGVTAEAADAAIADTIIRLAHKLGMKTVAEGVEADGQRAFLAASGCDELQGFLYCQPLEFERFLAFLTARRPAAAPASKLPAKRRQAQGA